VLYVCNVEEGSARTATAFQSRCSIHAKRGRRGCGGDLGQDRIRDRDLSREERTEFLDTLGLEEAGLDRLIRAGYQLLDLITYFTVGPKEARAWTINRGTKAPAAAGVIHTDFEKVLSAPRPSPMPIMSRSTAKPVPVMPASSGWKARNMSLPMATVNAFQVQYLAHLALVADRGRGAR